MNQAESPRVLCVDDDQSLLMLWKRGLEHIGLAVTVASDGEAAISELERTVFDVVLCDYRMPGLNGIDVLQRVRDVQPDASRVMISAQADFGMAVSAVNRIGLFRLLSKPISLHDLRQTLDEAVRAAWLRRDNRTLTTELAERNSRLEQLNAELETRVAAQTTHAVCAMLRTLGVWSEELYRHSDLTASLSRALAEYMGLPEVDVVATEHGALIHDVGLIAVPRSLLLYPGPLDEEGKAEIRKHVSVGVMLVRELGFLGDAIRVVSEHHEWWDGHGYPAGLSGEDIYIGARIVAVADAYASLTQGRPYRSPVAHARALMEIKQWSSTQFDRAVVTALCSMQFQDPLGFPVDSLGVQATAEQMGSDFGAPFAGE